MKIEKQSPGPEMSSASTVLDGLRREIDGIDDAIHDLLMRRAGVGKRMSRLKGDGPAIRPAREARLLRRLAARHRGDLPIAVVVRVWRELFAALTALQGPFAVAVGAPESDPAQAAALWDLAHDHTGVQTPMRAHADPLEVVRAVADGTATLGVLPLPDDGEPTPWWPALASEGAPRIVARLPFAPSGNARGADVDALAIACVAPEATGNDRGLLVFQTAAEVRRDKLRAAIRRVGLAPGALAGAAACDGVRQYVVEVDDFIGPADPRLGTMRDELTNNLSDVIPIGAYAVPIGDTR